MNKANVLAAAIAAALSLLSVAERNPVPKNFSTLAKAPSEELAPRALDARTYAKDHGFNTEVCFLVNLKAPSGSRRFVVFDLVHNKSLASGLVTHGRCNQNWLEGRRYGNYVGCGCSSLGRYRVGKPYFGRFGLAFKLYGFDSTNSNAYRRFVVLHSHDCVPSLETDGEICQSDGCPTVAPSFLPVLKEVIGKSPKPILLWIYG